MQQLSFDEMYPNPVDENALHVSSKCAWMQQACDVLDVEFAPGWTDYFGSQFKRFLETKNHKPIQVLSLFSGGGGLDIGFSDMGFHSIEMIELEEKYAKTLIHNTEPHKRLEGSVVHCVDIRDYYPSSDLKVDFIIGGPPCQTFSAAGRRAAGVAGTQDPRGTLFEEYVRLLSILSPRGFLFENVYGILGANKGKDWKEIISAFKQVGYQLFFRILDSADYGVPQHRERLIIVGLKEGEFLFPYPSHGPDSIGHYPFYVAGQAVNGLETQHLESGINGKYGHLLNSIPPGLNYSFYTENLGHPNPVFGWRSKFSDFLYKADPDMPVRTIKAQGGQYTGPFSWHNRPFSLEELKRLQTFPDDYNILGSRQVVIEQIGNSVPPQMARMLALSILDQVFHVDLPFTMNYMPHAHELGFRKRKRMYTEIYQEKAKEAISKLHTNTVDVNYEGVEHRFLSSKFDWSDKSLDLDCAEFELIYKLEENNWIIYCKNKDSLSRGECFDITIRPHNKAGWMLPLDQIRLYGMDDTFSTFTALWKSLEEKIYEFYGIADLVQLCGYYQYKPRMTCQMTFHREMNSYIWNVLYKIVQGLGVSKQVLNKDLANILDVDLSQVLLVCEKLRSIGYEVRNHNTNPQFSRNYYLIPYSFPTFTSRSVQLHKKLRSSK